MSFQLVERDWTSVLLDALGLAPARLRIVCPFIKRRAVERLLTNANPGAIQVITRFNLNDFAAGVSDLSALRLLLDRGAQVRGVKHLHAKIYLFGDSRAVVTSANLTLAALDRNHEFGFVASEPTIIKECSDYFGRLWKHTSGDLTVEQLSKWETKIAVYLASGACPGIPSGLGDEGADAGLQPSPTQLPVGVAETSQAFVKFFGWSQNRVARDHSIMDLVVSSGCHWACTYPKGKRPRQVRDGALMFTARLTKDPDIVIYGRATGMRHVEGRDDATPADIALRDWKKIWPHYIRVHNAEFIAGTLENGISLNEMMAALGPQSFAATLRRFENDPTADINLRAAYSRKPAMELTPASAEWLNERLQGAFNRYGKVPAADLERLDWPNFHSPAGDIW